MQIASAVSFAVSRNSASPTSVRLARDLGQRMYDVEVLAA
jgi:hypothetical protein